MRSIRNTSGRNSLCQRALAIASVGVSALAFPLGVPAQQWSTKGPAPRAFQSAILDTTTDTMVIFGGQTYPLVGSTNPGLTLNDTWRLNSATTASTALSWTQLKPTGTLPAPRATQSAVFSPASDTMIVFGGGLGFSSPCLNEAWTLQGVSGTNPDWEQLSPSGALPAPRQWHSAVYDPGTNTMIIYGGNNCFSTQFSDVWILSHADGTGGTPTWTELFPAGVGPGARESQSAVYDATNNIMIIFGGYASGIGAFNDTWDLSHANGQGGTPTWTMLSPSGDLPAPRSGLSAGYDPTHNILVISGGNGGSLTDTWVLSNANGLGGTPAWTQLNTGPTPDLPVSGTAVYNPTTNNMTVFGGITSGGIYLSDVYKLSKANGQ